LDGEKRDDAGVREGREKNREKEPLDKSQGGDSK